MGALEEAKSAIGTSEVFEPSMQPDGTLLLELGPKGIRCNAVNPTVVLTAMGKANWSDPVKAGPMLNKIPLGRFAEARGEWSGWGSTHRPVRGGPGARRRHGAPVRLSEPPLA